MSDEWTRPLTVDEMYGDWDVEWDDAMALTDVSLEPRSSMSILDNVGALDPDEHTVVLDIGGRDGKFALPMAERFGCRVIIVDPIEGNLDFARSDSAEHAAGHLIDLAQGTINDIPLGDDTVDIVFSRDMLGHVGDLDGALAECRRVLKPGGAMVIHEVFGTDLLEPLERARMVADLAMVDERLDVDLFESNVTSAGFTISDVEVIGSEWMEALLERENGERRLLQAARMRRNQDQIVEKVGVIPYRVMRSNTTYTIYRMIGKLEERIYTLHRSR